MKRRGKICKGCGKTFWPKHLNKAYCSDTCRIAWLASKGLLYLPRPRHTVTCLICNEEFQTKVPTAKYCSDRCRTIAWRQRLLTGPATAEQKIRFSILARDGFRCRYCGRSPADGVKLHVDHIVPQDKNGSSDPSNLVTACMDCNLGKGTMLLLAKKGQIPSFLTIESISNLPT